MKTITSVWQDYEIDPIDLIGKTVRLTVVTNDGPTSGANGVGRHGTGHYHFGVVESIHEHRGTVYLDQPGDNWVSEALSVTFGDVYPLVRVWFRGGHFVSFDPDKDAASFEWVEMSA